MGHRKLDILGDKGFVILKDHTGPAPAAAEWEGLEYMDWKSGGDTNFAPIASTTGTMDPYFAAHGASDKNAKWTTNKDICPTMVRWVESVGANFGRVRVIKLNPSDGDAALKQLHVDNNNELNPDDEGWVVRSWLELNAPAGSQFILREDKDDPSTESRIDLYPGRQLVIDTERLYHVVHNPGPGPRYALITSFESGDALQRWIESQLPVHVS